MNKLKLFKSIYLVFFLIFGSKSVYCTQTDPSKTVVGEVDVLEVNLAKTVHCIDYNKKTILQCKPKHVLIVHAAQWSNATCEQKKSTKSEETKTHLYFNRTETLQQLCDGLTYCFLKPSRTRDDHLSTFLGDPLVYHKLPNTNTTNNYSLTVSVSCLNRELSVKGRKVTDTFNAKENDVDFGCNEDEVIHLSVTRVDGYSEDGPNRLFKQFNYGPYVFDCNLKQKCVVRSEYLKKSESNKDFVFATGILVYYCRKPMKFSFCDHVVVKDDQTTEPYDKLVLYAEQDSQVTVKSPIFYVLKVESATWSTPEKLTDETVKKDRTELLKFLCENRNYCAFTPKRSAAGAIDSSFEEVHFGGMLLENKPLVLLVTFKTKHVKELKDLESAGLKTLTTSLTNKLKLECQSNEEGTLHVLSAVAGPTAKTNPNMLEASDLNSVKFKDLTKVLHKICYRKRVCEWNLNPVALNQGGAARTRTPAVNTNTAAPSSPAPSNLQLASMLELSSKKSPATQSKVPDSDLDDLEYLELRKKATPTVQEPFVPAGLKDQEITVKYMCKKYTHDPSLVDSLSKSPQLLQMSDALTGHTSTVDKEQAETVSLAKKSRLFINLEIFAACTVTVGDFFTVTVPDLGTGVAEAYFNANQNGKYAQALTNKSNKFVFYLGFLDESTVEFAMDVFDGVNENHYTRKLTSPTTLNYPINLKDVVKAKGGIVGMRVYLASK